MDILEIDTTLSYCPTTLAVCKPLKLTNVSTDELAFKIKTNKKNLVSMNPCNGFLKPLTQISIPVKIVESVPEGVTVKLQVDWCKVTPQMKEKNDIKMATVNEKDLFKKVFPIVRKQANQFTESVSKPSSIQVKQSLTQSVMDSRNTHKQQTKITPFQVEKKELAKVQQSPQKQPLIKAEIQKSSFVLDSQEIPVPDSVQQYRNASSTFKSFEGPVSPSKNLEIVSQEDQQDHEKELEQIRNQQIKQRRNIDQTKSKIRKLNQEVKSNEIVDPIIVGAAVVGSFFLGSFLQYLIF